MKKRQYKIIGAFVVFFIAMDQTLVFADTAISVPRDAHVAIENVKNDMAKIEAKKTKCNIKKMRLIM